MMQRHNVDIRKEFERPRKVFQYRKTSFCLFSPCQYVAAMLQDFCPRDKDLIQVFSTFLQKNIMSKLEIPR